MNGSLNPADYADTLRGVPQLHFIGGDDSIVPTHVARSYGEKLAGASRLQIVPLDGHDHTCCWVREWTKLRREYTPE